MATITIDDKCSHCGRTIDTPFSAWRKNDGTWIASCGYCGSEIDTKREALTRLAAGALAGFVSRIDGSWTDAPPLAMRVATETLAAIEEEVRGG